MERRTLQCEKAVVSATGCLFFLLDLMFAFYSPTLKLCPARNV
jgi:hypothetical protein